MELEEALEGEPHLRPYWVAAHARLKDLKLHNSDIYFLKIAQTIYKDAECYRYCKIV